MLTLLSWSHSRTVFSPSSETGLLYGLHVWAIHLNVLSLTVPKTLLQIRERSCSQSGNIKWILMSAASSAVESFRGEKKRKKGEWECTVVIFFYTKELALVTKQRALNCIELYGWLKCECKRLYVTKRLLHSWYCLIIWLCLVTISTSICCIQWRK